MKVLICSNTECNTFEWGNVGEEPDINQKCIFCKGSLREVTEEEQEEANLITEQQDASIRDDLKELRKAYLCSKF